MNLKMHLTYTGTFILNKLISEIQDSVVSIRKFKFGTSSSYT